MLYYGWYMNAEPTKGAVMNIRWADVADYYWTGLTTHAAWLTTTKLGGRSL